MRIHISRKVSQMEQILKKILKETMKLEVSGLEIQKLFGHASYRTYYRIILPNEKTFVVMQMPAGLSSVSEEITNFTGIKNELPYLNVQKYLKEIRLPVPEVYAWNPEVNLMVLEDLGDRLLESYLKDSTELIQLSFYKKAIDLLVKVQKRTQQFQNQPCIAFHRSFDQNLLNWEFNHFLEYGIEDRLQLKLDPKEKDFFSTLTQKITNEIISDSFIWVHRDFQSRNLILKDYELYLLDFQDALLGPTSYDLVSLIRDSYIQLSSESVNLLIDYYLKQRIKEEIPIEDEKKFKRLFDLVTVQRKLKDTGRFQYIHTVKGNSNFLVSVPASLGYVKEALNRLEEYQELTTWIGKYLPEFRT